MVVQYKGRPTYICNYLRQQNGEPVCQHLPAVPIDGHVVGQFFAALAPAELDLFERVRAEVGRAHDDLRRAREQQLERLRYHAELADRQFRKADPDNRLVVAELERRWEAALRELKQAEEQQAQAASGAPPDFAPLDPAIRQALAEAGSRLPEWWRAGRFTREQQKALLRCLVDKVVVRRLAADLIDCRVVWRGGEATTAEVRVTTGKLRGMTNFADMERRVVTLARRGRTDEQIATALSRRGFRSPRHDVVLPSTVRSIRLRHRVLIDRHQSHPRQVPGKLTVPQLAARLQVPVHWVYDRIHNGTIAITRDRQTGLYLFPDAPDTLRRLGQLRKGQVQTVRF
jgi:hypothetical protein